MPDVSQWIRLRAGESPRWINLAHLEAATLHTDKALIYWRDGEEEEITEPDNIVLLVDRLDALSSAGPAVTKKAPLHRGGGLVENF